MLDSVQASKQAGDLKLLLLTLPILTTDDDCGLLRRQAPIPSLAFPHFTFPHFVCFSARAKLS